MQGQFLPGDLREGISLQISPDRMMFRTKAQGGVTHCRACILLYKAPARLMLCSGTHMHTVMQFRPPTVRLRPVLSSALPASNDVWGVWTGVQLHRTPGPYRENLLCPTRENASHATTSWIPSFFSKPGCQLQGFQDISN